MPEHSGWLLDVYAAQPSPDGKAGVTLWLLSEEGQRLQLWQPFPATFYVHGPAERLRQVWRFLQDQPIRARLARVQRRDLFSPEPLDLLSVEVCQPAEQTRLFQQVSGCFPELSYFDADLQLSLRYAAAYGVFPLARCRVQSDTAGCIESIMPLDTPWELDPPPLPLRTLTIEPDVDPAHATPRRLQLKCERYEYELDLQPARALLVGLRAILERHDPDLLLSSWGDTWLLPLLLELSQKHGLALPLNRDLQRPVLHHPERTYFSYGQVVYHGREVLLFGRWHIDRCNAMLFHDYGMEGVYELARVTALPGQTAARVSPGTGISAMQILTALRMGILVPWHKQQVERPKTALDLLRADQGGLVYQPLTGLHHDVAEIDFISMYPSIMVHFNISPETVGTSEQIYRAARQMGPSGATPEGEPFPPGLVPQTLGPLLQKRLGFKTRLATMPRWHPNRKLYEARATAHKWLLVTCFGYLGYKNARFGRIEAHEAVTAYGREALLRAKEAAEAQGFEVLHLYVDGMWVRKPGARKVTDFQPLLDEILQQTGLPVALDGIYRWVAFLPSRQNRRVPVANRYFGVFQDGKVKLRGIEARRRDAAPFIVALQKKLIDLLSQVDSPDPRSFPLRACLSVLQATLASLRQGKIPLPDLLVGQKLSREMDAYSTPSPAARAAAQLASAGKVTRPGQRIKFIYTRGQPGVHAWDFPTPLDPSAVDVTRYSELLVRAAWAILQPFGVEEELLRQWLFANAAYFAPPGELPPRGAGALPLLAGCRRPTPRIPASSIPASRIPASSIPASSIPASRFPASPIPAPPIFQRLPQEQPAPLPD